MLSKKIKGVWCVLKGKYKQNFYKGTNGELKETIGKADEFIGWLQIATGKSKDEIVDFIDSSIITNKNR